MRRKIWSRTKNLGEVRCVRCKTIYHAGQHAWFHVLTAHPERYDPYLDAPMDMMHGRPQAGYIDLPLRRNGMRQMASTTSQPQGPVAVDRGNGVGED